MPRPKGSKNRAKTVEIVISAPEEFAEKIAAVEKEIEEATVLIKAKKAELKELYKAREEAEKVAAERKAEEDKAKLLEAVIASGKSIEDVIEMLK